MLKGWKPIIEDIRSEIERLKVAVSDAQFNSDFGSNMHIVKIRTAELQDRLFATRQQMKSEAASQRELIDTLMAEFLSEVKDVSVALKDLRILRHQRSHENYLHVLQLKEQQEGGKQ